MLTAAAYREAMVFLATAAIVVPTVKRFRMSPVLGFLAAGVIMGPSLARLLSAFAPQAGPWIEVVTFSNADHIKALAELGVIMLMFMIGLELSFERLVLMRRLVFGLGLAQVLLSMLVLGTIATYLGMEPGSALALGAALSLSSTAIALPVLAEHGRLHSQAGRASFSVLLFQDLAVPLFIVLFSALGRHSEGLLTLQTALPVTLAMLALGGLVAMGRLLLRPLFHLVATAQSKELFMAACLLVVMATSIITGSVGLSMEIGAFVAGLLLAETEYRRQVEATVEPFKGLLLGLFFMSVGASLDLTVLWENLGRILIFTLLLIIIKVTVVYALAVVFRLSRYSAIETALVLSPGGEFAFVLIAIGLSNQILSPLSASVALVIVTLSMALLPVLASLGRRIAARRPLVLPAEALEAVPEAEAPRVILVGFGRVGRLIAELLEAHKVNYIAIDSDARLVAYQRKKNRPVYYGDTTDMALFTRLNMGKARALVLTIDDPKVIEAIATSARAEFPDLTIVSRAKDATHAAQLYALGVTDAVPETIEASLQLSEAVLVDIGVPMGLVIASVHEKRDEFRRLLAGEGAVERQRHAIRRHAQSGHKPKVS